MVKKNLRPTLVQIFGKRLALLRYGNRDGVSLNYLQKNANGVFINLEDLVNYDGEFSKNILNYLDKARNLFNEYSKSQISITSSRWNAELQLFSLLYSLIRATNINNIVETGVANGFTTNAIMKALEENNNDGMLNSFDVLPETKNVYKGMGNWNFNLLSQNNTHKQIIQIVSKLPKIDLWVHDSNHGYRWQKFEYQLAFKKLNTGGILISDDIDASPAWGELSETLFRKSYIIFDSRKFIGIALK